MERGPAGPHASLEGPNVDAFPTEKTGRRQSFLKGRTPADPENESANPSDEYNEIENVDDRYVWEISNAGP